jgi:long-chain acyl-CoA synthetase
VAGVDAHAEPDARDSLGVQPVGIADPVGNFQDRPHPASPDGIIGPSDLQYFWLPLAHVFGKAVIAICIGIGIPTAVDGRVDRIAENLGVVKPTFVGAVPRIFEKVHAKVLGQALAAGGAKAAISRGRSASA